MMAVHAPCVHVRTSNPQARGTYAMLANQPQKKAQAVAERSDAQKPSKQKNPKIPFSKKCGDQMVPFWVCLLTKNSQAEIALFCAFIWYPPEPQASSLKFHLVWWPKGTKLVHEGIFVSNRRRCELPHTKLEIFDGYLLAQKNRYKKRSCNEPERQMAFSIRCRRFLRILSFA